MMPRVVGASAEGGLMLSPPPAPGVRQRGARSMVQRGGGWAHGDPRGIGGRGRLWERGERRGFTARLKGGKYIDIIPDIPIYMRPDWKPPGGGVRDSYTLF